MSTVLVGDEDGEFRRFVKIALTRAGHTVWEAGNAEGVLAAARRTHPDVVLLELDLGGPTGLDVARELHSDAAFTHLPIILLTADAPAHRLGIRAVLNKPVDPDALVEAVAHVVQNPAG